MIPNDATLAYWEAWCREYRQDDASPNMRYWMDMNGVVRYRHAHQSIDVLDWHNVWYLVGIMQRMTTYQTVGAHGDLAAEDQHVLVLMLREMLARLHRRIRDQHLAPLFEGAAS